MNAFQSFAVGGAIAWVLVVGAFVALRLDTIADRMDTIDIAGTEVRSLHCEEDEAIWWTDVDQLGCVHADDVR